ncbi:MAG: hypothetical protein QOF44_750, partial [Streptomyces sp.]|nr:hypothetical protein [Streptomyces sp.]
MKETSSHPTAPQTELRLARGLWDGFRQDFITDAFALRPLPLLPADSAFIRLLPDNAVRGYARRLPHIAIGLLAFLLLTFGFLLQSGSDPTAAFAALFAAV